MTDQTVLKAPLVGGGYAEPRASDESILLANQRSGVNYVDAKAGRIFSQANTPLGIAIPLYTATDLLGCIVLKNPEGSGVNVDIVEWAAAWASGTSAFASVGIMVRPYNTTTLSAIVQSTPFNAKSFGGNASVIHSANAGQQTVSAGVAADWKRTIGNMNLEADTGTAHGLIPGICYRPEGSLILQPGTFAYLAATKASVALFTQHVIWKEVPLVGA